MTDDYTTSMIFIILIKRHYDIYIMKALGLCSGQLQNCIAMRITQTLTLHKAIKDFMFLTILDKIKNKENKNKKTNHKYMNAHGNAVVKVA